MNKVWKQGMRAVLVLTSYKQAVEGAGKALVDVTRVLQNPLHRTARRRERWVGRFSATP